MLLACIVVNKYAVFIWILGFQWLMQVHRNKYLQDYRRPFSSCKPDEEWPHIVLPCYFSNCFGKQFFAWETNLEEIQSAGWIANAFYTRM